VGSLKPIRVLCADDHALIRDGVCFALQEIPDIKLVAEAEDGIAAVEAFRIHQPDVVLMDLQMPRLSGIDALVAIRELDPKAKCIVLTTYEGDAQASRALKAGAMGYLLKKMLRKSLVETIRAVYAGNKCVPREVALDIAEHLGVEDLSDREVEVLRSVAAGCSNKIVADRLSISENTVKGHLKSIVAKLQASDRTHAVQIAMKRGYFDI
jgi:DNA-binding NarL/FixJ family response regulator